MSILNIVTTNKQEVLPEMLEGHSGIIAIMTNGVTLKSGSVFSLSREELEDDLFISNKVNSLIDTSLGTCFKENKFDLIICKIDFFDYSDIKDPLKIHLLCTKNIIVGGNSELEYH